MNTNGSAPLKMSVSLHLRRRHALEVERSHRHRRREERGLQVQRHQDAEEDRVDAEVWSSGRKIGTKMMMISVHSSGQPSRKMMNWVSSRNMSGDEVERQHELLDHRLAAEQANTAEKVHEPTNR